MATRDDTALVGLAQVGDSAAFGELFERYHKKIYNYAYGIAGNPEDAKDIAQDAFVRVFQALPKKDGPINFSAYLYRTTHNLACDALGARKRFAGPDALDLEHEPALRADPERVTLVREQQTQARQAAFALTEQHRAVLTLRELHDMSYQEIADVLEMPRNTVGVYLSRARLEYKEAFRMSAVDVEKLAEECKEMLPQLSAYIDNELQHAERARVDAHLDECPLCRLALEEMQEASKSYRGLIPLLPPADSAEAVMGRLSGMSKVRVKRGVGRSAWVLVPIALLLAGAMTAGAFFVPVDGDADGEEPAVVASAPLTPTVDSPQPPAAVLPTEGSGTPLPPPTPEPQPDPEPVTVDTEAPATPGLISPDDGTYSSEPTFTLTWEPVEDPSGVSYTVEIETLTGDGYVPHRRVVGLGETSLVHVLDTLRQRWRVRAVDGAGNESDPSDWREFGVMILLTPPLELYEPPTLY